MRFRKIDDNRVAMVSNGAEAILHVPTGGGYVRLENTGRQICRRLFMTGETLTAKNAEHMLRVLRREWAARRRTEGGAAAAEEALLLAMKIAGEL